MITEQGRRLQQALGVYVSGGGTVCSLIARHSKTYHRLMEDQCNYSWACEPRFERRVERLEKRLEALVARLGEGYELVTSGDPRGYCVYIKTPDNRVNGDWGGRGVHGWDY